MNKNLNRTLAALFLALSARPALAVTLEDDATRRAVVKLRAQLEELERGISPRYGEALQKVQTELAGFRQTTLERCIPAKDPQESCIKPDNRDDIKIGDPENANNFFPMFDRIRDMKPTDPESQYSQLKALAERLDEDFVWGGQTEASAADELRLDVGRLVSLTRLPTALRADIKLAESGDLPDEFIIIETRGAADPERIAAAAERIGVALPNGMIDELIKTGERNYVRKDIAIAEAKQNDEESPSKYDSPRSTHDELTEIAGEVGYDIHLAQETLAKCDKRREDYEWRHEKNPVRCVVEDSDIKDVGEERSAAEHDRLDRLEKNLQTVPRDF